MKRSACLKSILMIFVLLFAFESSFSCSMYKVTVNGKTMVGCNEDAWRLTSRIWFEAGQKPGHYGVAFTGSRIDGANGYAPQSGMNEYGLVYSRLAASAPEEPHTAPNKKKTINNPTQYLKDILHACKTVDEVKAFIDQYDYSYFSEDVFIYVDRSGRYLIVEPYSMTIGNDDSYVLSNFCPSVTSENEAQKLARYRNGKTLLNTRIDTSLSFCTALSDTMHVCREKIGDGTLLTSIWDLKEGVVYLYFYHDYEHPVQFNIKDELAKGDHTIEIPDLFPPNAEYDKLKNYKIPQNNRPLMLLVMCAGGLFIFSALFFLISYFRNRKKERYANIRLVLFASGMIMFYYMYILATEINVFYFPAPYEDTHFSVLTIMSYTPYLLILLTVPLAVFNFKVFREKAWGSFSKWLLTLYNIACLLLIAFFDYWGLF